jgi:hypothetical protein
VKREIARTKEEGKMSEGLGMEIPDFVRMCDCAGCRKPLFSRHHEPTCRWFCCWLSWRLRRKHDLHLVEGYVKDRPYCAACHASALLDAYADAHEQSRCEPERRCRVGTVGGVRFRDGDEAAAGQENAIRDYEDRYDDRS